MQAMGWAVRLLMFQSQSPTFPHCLGKLGLQPRVLLELLAVARATAWLLPAKTPWLTSGQPITWPRIQLPSGQGWCWGVGRSFRHQWFHMLVPSTKYRHEFPFPPW